MNWDYIAGFFDGEGCINLKGFTALGRPRYRIYITNTDKECLNEIKSFIEKGLGEEISLYKSIPNKNNYRTKDCYILSIHKISIIYNFINVIVDRCVIKRKKLFEIKAIIGRTRNLKWVLIDRNKLYDFYINKKLGCYKIGKLFGVHGNTVYNKLKKYNIPTREWNKGRFKWKNGKCVLK